MSLPDALLTPGLDGGQPGAAMASGDQAVQRELHWLQLLAAAEIVRAPADPSGVRLPEAARAHLLGQLSGQSPPAPTDPAALRARAARIRAEIAAREAGDGPGGSDGGPDRPVATGGDGLRRLADAFGLDELDRRLLVVVAAPDLDARFGYLNAVVLGDPGRRAASVELAVRLLAGAGEGDEWAVRGRLDLGGRLVRDGLVEAEPGPPFPFRALHLPDSLVHLLATGRPMLDPRLVPAARLSSPGAPAGPDPCPAVGGDQGDPGAAPDGLEPATGLSPATGKGLARVAAVWASGRPYPVLVLRAARGAPVGEALDTLAARCRRRLVTADLARLARCGPDPARAVALLARDARAAGALLALTATSAAGPPGGTGTDPVSVGDPTAAPLLAAVARLLEKPPLPVAIVHDDAAPLPVPAARAMRLDLPAPGTAARTGLWRAALRAHGLPAGNRTLRELAATFVLSPEQIRHAARNAALARRIDPTVTPPAAVRAAAAAAAVHTLDTVARRIEPAATWDDLVLPAPALTQLRELAAAARWRRPVLEEWGLGRLARAHGVSALFHGRSGTGKTTAAEVLAGDLGVALYAIDLATVVSKWIGETEKNLRRIFAAARTANAVLLFDEADALFGRRTDVKDAHDRYANTEIAYLLQLMDTFDGIAVLATNLAGNLDPAFTRRLQYTVEFPLPDAELRARLWRLALPPGVPTRGIDVDFAAEHFDLTGGGIRNAALHASCLAAANGGTVTMPLLALAVAREYQKLHRIPSPQDFGPWYPGLAADLRGGDASGAPRAVPGGGVAAGGRP